jgi:hypothetical protein
VNFSLTANSTLTLNWIPFLVGETLDSTPGANQIVLRWPSMAGKSYDILFASSLNATFNPVVTDIPATPPNNTYSVAITPGSKGFYKVQMK